MPDLATTAGRRERTSEDPWTIVHRVVHDLRRDGIHADAPDYRMPTAVRYAALLLEVLGVAAVVPDEPGQRDQPGVAQPGGGWISGPSSPPVR